MVSFSPRLIVDSEAIDPTVVDVGDGLIVVDVAAGGCRVGVGLGPDFGQRCRARIDELRGYAVAGVWGAGIIDGNAGAVGENRSGKIAAPWALRVVRRSVSRKIR